MIACQEPAGTSLEQHESEALMKISSVAGNYVTNSYAERDEGADWMVVSIEEVSTHQAWVTIRSRSDDRRPQCSFSGSAYSRDRNSLVLPLNEGQLILEFIDDLLTIHLIPPTENFGFEGYCQEGKTFLGLYCKLDLPLDTTHLRNWKQ